MAGRQWDADDDRWAADWNVSIEKMKDDSLAAGGDGITYQQSAAMLRDLMMTERLSQTDLRDRPQRFFAAHRILSNWATYLGPGFGIRFTVQYNLFAGTVLACGTTDQVAQLDDLQRAGKLGCFALTERLAGVHSGLVVNTTATWRNDGSIILNTPNDGAVKNWISQGCTADSAVVVATLFDAEGKSHGPHAFLMDLRRGGRLVDGVTIGDMGPKTIGNDLDNAWIRFTNVRLDASALLSKFGGLDGAGRYDARLPSPADSATANIEMIGQRLYTGRAVIAESTLVFTKTLFARTKAYSDKKKCYTPMGEPPSLSEIPQVNALFEEAELRLGRLFHLCALVEEQLTPYMRTGVNPSREVIDAVAVMKVKCIETSIDLCFRLKNEVGSYALMGGTGFDKLDFLQCCKFAEGDSRILMQKIARDRLIEFHGDPSSGSEEEQAACMGIGMAMMAVAGEKPTKASKAAAWAASWKEIYGLADLVMERILDEWVPVSVGQSKL